ncbi:MAG: UDP-N-acetyl-D-glucosamine 2-epimerase, UDP-hydrolysing [Candidatus Giovannonibacteria bacterium GW2011_GWC2_44_8]|nr:MAG: UDP-N-acetyl-D-glucosamine 2-epimerase, UDP-hydrolysing [Candidatus Giovannonibacteria bacterium GW2011_GWC2_44_8]
MKVLLKELQEHPDIDLQIICTGALLVDRYGEKVLEDLEASGFKIQEKILSHIEGGNHVAMAKTAGLVALEATNILQKLDPDIAVVCGDRSEVLAMTIAATYMNKPVAHIEGGDLSGSIDESVRHAITKLAHVHFVTNEDSRKRVVQMGENPKYVFNFGSPDVEFASLSDMKITNEIVNNRGVGDHIDITKPFLTVIQHPVTTERDNFAHIETTLDAVLEAGIPAIWFWPNNDAGTNEMSRKLREFHEKNLTNHGIRFILDLKPDDFTSLLKTTSCLVGNSSSGIKECSYFGTPVVNIGSRQNGRTRGPNVIDVSTDKEEIKKAITAQLSHGPYPRSDIYYKPDTSKNIAATLANIELYTQKSFHHA